MLATNCLIILRHFNVTRELKAQTIQIAQDIGARQSLLGNTYEDCAGFCHMLGYIEGANVVIHNAPFDLGFLNKEMELLGRPDH